MPEWGLFDVLVLYPTSTIAPHINFVCAKNRRQALEVIRRVAFEKSKRMSHFV